MAETEHYGLFVTDDDSTKFSDWRTQMNGVSESNMTKIDDALYRKADSSRTIESTLFSGSWEGESAPYSQRIMIDGMTADQNGSISISMSANTEQKNAARKAGLFIFSQEAGSLTVSADGILPTTDIPVTVILIG